MKYQLGSLTVEAIDTYVRVTLDNQGGIAGNKKIACTDHECPSAQNVADLISKLRDMPPGRLNSAELQACGRAAVDARDNKAANELNL